MVRSERTVVCRLWSLMLIRRKRVGVRQCGGDGEGGRAGAGESSRAMAAMAMMAVMAGDSERRAAAKEERRQQAASSVSPRGGRRSGAAGEAREIPQGKFPRCSHTEKRADAQCPRCKKRADAQREMRRQNGQREAKFLFSSGRDDFSLSESFCKTAATALIRIVESCLGCIWACYLVDHHDVSDWGQNPVRRFVGHPPQQPQSRRR